MRTYEALFIVRPEASEEEVQAIATEVEKLVTDGGGAIVRSEIWGKRRLAYEVSKCTEGNYVLIRFQCDPSFPQKLEQYFRLHESVIRDIVVYFDEHTLKFEAEQIRRNEAELARTGGRPRDDDDDDRPRYRDNDDDRPRYRDRDDRPPRRDRDDRPPRADAPKPAPAEAPKPEAAAAPETEAAPASEPAPAPTDA